MVKSQREIRQKWIALQNVAGYADGPFMRRALIPDAVGFDKDDAGLLGIHVVDFDHVVKDVSCWVVLGAAAPAPWALAEVDHCIAVRTDPTKPCEQRNLGVVVVLPFFVTYHAKSFWCIADFAWPTRGCPRVLPYLAPLAPSPKGSVDAPPDERPRHETGYEFPSWTNTRVHFQPRQAMVTPGMPNGLELSCAAMLHPLILALRAALASATCYAAQLGEAVTPLGLMQNAG
jgi:hypothetical protein